MELLTFTERGIYCPQGDFYIDPWQAVPKAVISHAHSDHARIGMGMYLSTDTTAQIMKYRFQMPDLPVKTLNFGETIFINGVKLSLHPAGHIPGSAQVRVEYKGRTEVFSGDYKITPDGISEPFEPLKCNTFITETTFGLPIFNWEPQIHTFEKILSWWIENKTAGKPSLLLGYSLGKAQRLIHGLSGHGPIFCHGAVFHLSKLLIPHLDFNYLQPGFKKQDLVGAMIIAPPSAANSIWAAKIGSYSLGIASGWMALRGIRRRKAADLGFVLSDHADWQQLNEVISLTGAEKVITTHGYSTLFARWLKEKGIEAVSAHTEYEGESQEINSDSKAQEEI